MTVNTTSITNGPYTGNGLSDTYNYTFRISDESEIIVYETTDEGVLSTLVLNTDYTVTGVGNDAGGTVVRTAGELPSGYEWYIRSGYDLKQLTDFESQGAFFPSLHEAAMDKITFLLQQAEDRINRSFRFSDSYSGSAQTNVPAAVAGAYLRWNAAGDQLINDEDLVITSEFETNIGVVADNIDDVNTCADNIAAIQAAPGAATSAAASATAAGEDADAAEGFKDDAEDAKTAAEAAQAAAEAAVARPVSIESTDFTAVAGGIYLIDVSSEQVDVQLPASPAIDDQPITITHYKGDISTNKILVTRNSNNIMALAEDMDVTTQYATFTLRYSDAAVGWVISE